jgi:WD40 repeat protein
MLYQHEDSVLSLAVDERDGSVLSGAADGTICRWREGEDDAEILFQHQHAVRAVAVDFADFDSRIGEPRNISDAVYAVAVRTPDGSVFSGGGDGTVRRWAEGADEAPIVYRHRDWVVSVAIDKRDGSVISGGLDKTIRRWQEGKNDAAILYRHQDSVRSVAVDLREGAVLSGGDDGAVCRWQDGMATASVLYRHGGRVQIVVVDPFADSILSGGDDANLRLFRNHFRDSLMLLTPSSILSAACSLKHNRIALALGDGRLVFVCVEPSAEALLHWWAAS